jgi:hypothetical protein
MNNNRYIHGEKLRVLILKTWPEELSRQYPDEARMIGSEKMHEIAQRLWGTFSKLIEIDIRCALDWWHDLAQAAPQSMQKAGFDAFISSIAGIAIQEVLRECPSKDFNAQNVLQELIKKQIAPLQ